MKNIKTEEIQQLINIFETMIEATEHLQKQIRDKQFSHALKMFTSIVEGLTELDPVVKQLDNEQLSNEKRKLDHAALLIAKELENQTDLKILEIIQFNLLPTLNKILALFIEQLN